jgi:hypothetical protein
VNYTDLRAAIQQYSENFESSFAERIDTFIRQAENRLNHLVRMPPTRKQVAGFLTLGDNLLAPPSDYLSCDALFIIDQGESVPLENKNPDFITACYPLASDLGRPRYYGQLDDMTLQIGPTPDLAYPMVMDFFAYPPSIVVAQRTYLGDRCESLLLYACLLEAYSYMKGEMELMQWYDKRFQEAASLYKQLADGRQKKDSYQEPDRRIET